MKFASRALAAILTFALSIAATTSSAATYILDADQSFIRITGNIDLGAIQMPIVAQSTGSNRVRLQGTINADNLGSVLQFNSALIDGIENPGPFSPGVVSGDPPVIGPDAPADVALYLLNRSTGSLVLRDLLVNMVGSAGLTGSDFDLTPITLSISGSGDYNVSLLGLGAGNLQLEDESSEFPSGVGTLVDGQMFIPIQINIVENIVVDDEDPESLVIPIVVSLNGQIVATVVPEPGSIAMLGAGLIGLVVVGRRRFRKA